MQWSHEKTHKIIKTVHTAMSAAPKHFPKSLSSGRLQPTLRVQSCNTRRTKVHTDRKISSRVLTNETRRRLIPHTILPETKQALSQIGTPAATLGRLANVVYSIPFPRWLQDTLIPKTSRFTFGILSKGLKYVAVEITASFSSLFIKNVLFGKCKKKRDGSTVHRWPN